MSLALVRSAAKNATAFAAGLRPAAPRASGGRHMVVARGDCVGLQVQQGAASVLELKERFRQGLEEHLQAALSLPAAWGGCLERGAGESETAAADVAGLDAKLAACQELAEEAMGGASHAALGITELLADDAPEVRRAAVEALVGIAEFGPRSAVNAAGVALRLSDPGLRWRSHEHGLAMAAIGARVSGA